jgi:hypothetical protein
MHCITILLEAKQIIRSLLKLNPDERMSLEAFLSHPWINGGTANAAPLTGTITRMQSFNSGRKGRVIRLFLFNQNAIFLWEKSDYWRINCSTDCQAKTLFSNFAITDESVEQTGLVSQCSTTTLDVEPSLDSKANFANKIIKERISESSEDGSDNLAGADNVSVEADPGKGTSDGQLATGGSHMVQFGTTNIIADDLPPQTESS